MKAVSGVAGLDQLFPDLKPKARSSDTVVSLISHTKPKVKQILEIQYEIEKLVNSGSFYASMKLLADIIEKGFNGLISKRHRSPFTFNIRGMEYTLLISNQGWRKLYEGRSSNVSKPVFEENSLDINEWSKILFSTQKQKVRKWLTGIGNRYNGFLNMFDLYAEALAPYMENLEENPHLDDREKMNSLFAPSELHLNGHTYNRVSLTNRSNFFEVDINISCLSVNYLGEVFTRQERVLPNQTISGTWELLDFTRLEDLIFAINHLDWVLDSLEKQYALLEEYSLTKSPIKHLLDAKKALVGALTIQSM